jgi:hypothetical protein
MMRGVASANVAALLEKISIPSGRGVNRRFDCKNLSKYTSESTLFPEWDVVIATGESLSRGITVQNKFLPAAVRTFRLGAASENYIRMGGSNNRIVDPGIFNSGLIITHEQKQRILLRKKPKRTGGQPNQLSVTDWLKLREHPLLAIYLIDLKIDEKNLPLSERERYVAAKEAFSSDLLVGFAVGFPAKEAKELLRYRGNLVKVAELNGDDDEFEEEELGDE